MRLPTQVFAALMILLGLPPLRGAASKQNESPTFAVGVETVFIQATVTDFRNQRVVGLSRDCFHIYENSVEQNISFFREETDPVSIGLIFDTSGSMSLNHKIYAARSALLQLLTNADPRDEFFLLAFNQTPRIVVDFTSDADSVQRQASSRQFGGNTALYDAIYMGLEKVRSGKNPRKAIIIFSDFEENRSRYTFSEVEEFAKEMDVRIYAVGECRNGQPLTAKSYVEAIEWRTQELRIENIARITGGQIFFAGNMSELDFYLSLIYSELRNSYILGYTRRDATFEGTWRRIQIKLDESLPKLAVHARGGYYVPRH